MKYLDWSRVGWTVTKWDVSRRMVVVHVYLVIQEEANEGREQWDVEFICEISNGTGAFPF